MQFRIHFCIIFPFMLKSPKFFLLGYDKYIKDYKEFWDLGIAEQNDCYKKQFGRLYAEFMSLRIRSSGELSWAH
jgi:hypothetical protein